MWTLLLSRHGAAPGAFLDRRRLDHGRIAIGSDTGACDWIIADSACPIEPEHCTISIVGLHLFVTDTSTGGVRLNHPDQRVAPQQPIALRVGDRLLLGEYAIEVATEAAGFGAHLAVVPAPVSEAAIARAQPDPWFHAGTAEDPVWGVAAPSVVDDFLGTPAPVRQDLPPTIDMIDPGAWHGAFDRPLRVERGASGQANSDFPPSDAATPQHVASLPSMDDEAATPQPAVADDGRRADWLAFCDGAGIDPAELWHAPDTMRRAGVLYRELVSGLSGLVCEPLPFGDAAPARPRCCNPIEHLEASDLPRLLLADPLPGVMGATAAVRASIDEVRARQHVVCAEMGRALRRVVRRLSPDEVERLADVAGRKSRMFFHRGADPWRLYRGVFEALRHDALLLAGGPLCFAFRDDHAASPGSVLTVERQA